MIIQTQLYLLSIVNDIQVIAIVASLLIMSNVAKSRKTRNEEIDF